MAIVTGNSSGLELAKAIGLETVNLHSFELRVDPSDLITVTAVYFVTQEGLSELKEVVKSFTLQSNE